MMEKCYICGKEIDIELIDASDSSLQNMTIVIHGETICYKCAEKIKRYGLGGRWWRKQAQKIKLHNPY